MANTETARHANWAQRMRRWLVKQLGGACALCGSNRKLQVDHVRGRSWRLTDYSQRGRVRKYLEEFHAGVELRCLCKPCNGGYNPYGR